MKPVLIISYYFPPGNFAGSYRIKSWADYLHKFGYYPIIITRHWDENETDYTAISTKKEIEKEENEHYSVYRLPYKGSWRDRLVKRFGEKAILPGKLLSFFQLFWQNFFLFSNPFSNLYFFARNYLCQNPDVSLLIISGKPFIQFRFGFLLKKEFSALHWVADYRDEWNSQPRPYKPFKSLPAKILSRVEVLMEKKWLAYASSITTVSDIIKDQITRFIDFKGQSAVILNGFDPADFKNIDWASSPNSKVFKVLHSGTIYSFQDLKVLADGFRKFVIENETDQNIELVFAGLNKENFIEKKVRKLFAGLEKNVKITPRLPKPAFLKLMQESHVLLVFPYNALNGCFSSKVFEYLPTQRPILLAPPDKQVISELITSTNTGYVAQSAEEVNDFFKEQFEQFKKGNFKLNQDQKNIEFFSRIHQTELLAKELDLLL